MFSILYYDLFCKKEEFAVKKRLAVSLFPAGMSFTKLSLAGNNLIFPGQGEFGE
jgi:hypothetical protein